MIEIRTANQSDTIQLEDLFLTTRQHTFNWMSANTFKREDFKKSTEGEILFVAEENGKIIGFISIWEHDSLPFIHHLFVSKDYQRQGVGSALIRSLFSQFSRPYRLKCVVKNQKAIEFYLKNNWVEVGHGISEEGDYVVLELNA